MISNQSCLDEDNLQGCATDETVLQ